MPQTKSDPLRVRLLLALLAALGAWGLWRYGAGGDPARAAHNYKWMLRSAALLATVAPALGVSLAGYRSAPVWRLFLAVSLMGYLVLRGAVDLGAMWAAHTAWPWLLGGALLAFTQPFLGAARWRILLRVQEIPLTRLESLRLVLASSFFNTCLPGATGGDIFRAYAMGRGRQTTAAAAVTVLLDRLMGLAGLVLLCGGAVLWNLCFLLATPGLREAVGALALVFLLLSLLLLAMLSPGLAERLRRTRLAALPLPGAETIRRAFRAMRSYHGRPGPLALAVFISILSHLATVGSAALFGQALGITGVSLSQYLVLVPLGLAVNALPLSPGGLGVGQKAFAQIFTWALPGVASAGGLGGALMTFLHISLFLVSAAGGAVYAAGYHHLHEAALLAEEEEEAAR